MKICLRLTTAAAVSAILLPLAAAPGFGAMAQIASKEATGLRRDMRAPILLAAEKAADMTGAGEIHFGSLTLSRPWLRETPNGAKVGAGYVTIVNNGSAPDRLIAASSPAAGNVQIHSMTMQEGVMHMRQLTDGLEIPPQSKVELRPGGLHLMFVDLKNPLKSGETFGVRLQFEKAGEVEADFPVSQQEPLGGETAAPEPMQMQMHMHKN
jgi:periplasmic copper chaperone A